MREITVRLSPPARLTQAHLADLARTIREEAPQGDLKADSVAAALESVALRRSSESWLKRSWIVGYLVRKVLAGPAPRLSPRSLHAAAAALPPNESRPSPGATSSAVPRPADPMKWQAVAKALADIQRGKGVQPDLCDSLLKRGWVQWQHQATGEVVDPCHPRSQLQITAAGVIRLEQVEERFADELVSVHA